MYKIISNTIIVVLSLVTASGVFMHDSRLDKMITTGLSSLGNSPTTTVGSGDIAAKLQQHTSVDSHTHPDHNAATRNLLPNFGASQIIGPNKYQKRGAARLFQSPHRHAFDDIMLPVIEKI